MNRLLLVLLLSTFACDTNTPVQDPTKPSAQPAVAEVKRQEVVGTTGGITLRGVDASKWTDGQPIPAGTQVETDHSTRARLQLGEADVTISHATALKFVSKEKLELVGGRVVIESGESPLTVVTPSGAFALHQAKVSLVAVGGTVRASVSRGFVELQAPTNNILVHPGMEASWQPKSEPVVRWDNSLGSELGWSSLGRGGSFGGGGSFAWGSGFWGGGSLISFLGWPKTKHTESQYDVSQLPGTRPACC